MFPIHSGTDKDGDFLEFSFAGAAVSGSGLPEINVATERNGNNAGLNGVDLRHSLPVRILRKPPLPGIRTDA
ncbi:hypothetical protein TWF481_003895 [Arthrobotrys musiformis]|uniref:Uncharacterized protein n=1 Tax=Arthrobotrys musiformis TaxID=47236 RepID=A0AAV9WJZ4_9PEZI